MRLPFKKSRPDRVRTVLVPGLTIASVIALALVIGKVAGAWRGDQEAETGDPAAPPTGTATSTPDKPAGTELHPPNENFSRQGPGKSGGKPSPKAAKPSAGTNEPPSSAGPGQPGITAPKR